MRNWILAAVVTLAAPLSLASALDFSEFTGKTWQAQKTDASTSAYCPFQPQELARLLGARGHSGKEYIIWERHLDGDWRFASIAEMSLTAGTEVSDPRPMSDTITMTIEKTTKMLSPKHVQVVSNYIYKRNLYGLNLGESSRETTDFILKVSDDGHLMELTSVYKDSRDRKKPELVRYCVFKAVE